MVYFFASPAIVFFFFIFISFLAFRSRAFYLFFGNLIGALSAAMAVILELNGQQTKLSMLILSSLILMVLLFDFVAMVIRSFKDKQKKGFVRNEVQANRDERLILREKDFQKNLALSSVPDMTDHAQALQMWQAGNEAFLHDQFDEAAEKYQISFKWQPTAAARVNLSAVHLAQNRFEEALRACDEAVQLNPSHKEARINRGLAFAGLNKNEEALQSYRKALSEDEKDPALSVLISKTERRLGHLQKSLDTIDQALELYQEVKDGWFCKGVTLDLSGKLDDAVGCFEKALFQQPKDPSIHYHLANSLNKLDRNEEAIASYRKVIKLSPVYPEAWNNLGIAQSKTGSLQDSVKSYRKAIEMKPDYYEAWLNIALACDSLKNFADAADAYRKFLEFAPESLVKHRAIAIKNLELVEKKQTTKLKDSSALKTGEEVTVDSEKPDDEKPDTQTTNPENTDD